METRRPNETPSETLYRHGKGRDKEQYNAYHQENDAPASGGCIAETIDLTGEGPNDSRPVKIEVQGNDTSLSQRSVRTKRNTRIVYLEFDDTEVKNSDCSLPIDIERYRDTDDFFLDIAGDLEDRLRGRSILRVDIIFFLADVRREKGTTITRKAVGMGLEEVMARCEGLDPDKNKDLRLIGTVFVQPSTRSQHEHHAEPRQVELQHSDATSESHRQLAGYSRPSFVPQPGPPSQSQGQVSRPQRDDGLSQSAEYRATSHQSPKMTVAAPTCQAPRRNPPMSGLPLPYPQGYQGPQAMVHPNFERPTFSSGNQVLPAPMLYDYRQVPEWQYHRPPPPRPPPTPAYTAAAPRLPPGYAFPTHQARVQQSQVHFPMHRAPTGRSGRE